GYITHTSDSLYLTVKDYFSDHHRKEMLPEVLYYGGRVYSDMGVYPVALQYFRDALALMGRSRADMNLRQRALSQTGRLLSALDLHGDALPYV
ncbi:MAG: tetratricopeptide repeat protein, partial [Muribaculaceae bacterium]|nr:tetratricopeptide repeat protein [Muribaculaceae bacterium]